MSSPEITSRLARAGRPAARDLSRGRLRRALRALRELGPRQVVALARAHGPRESARFVWRNVRHIIAHRLALRWDRRYGVDTAGSIQLRGLTITGPHAAAGNECVCTAPKAFDFMMRCLPGDLSRYTFVDIGAGKSRTLLLASRYGFAKIIGVEFARELADCARANIGRFRADWQRCRDLEIVEGDAAEFDFPDTPLVIFFYNPFARDVFELVLNNIVASLTADERDCILVYASSSHDAIDWARPAIAGTGLFAEIRSAPMPWFFDAVRPVRYAVFRSR